jgi:exodeoxyribonuclease VII small subunit
MARTAKRSPSERASSDEDRAATNTEPQGIDGILDGLEGVVKQLEEGDLPLERALERFEEGVRLARRGSQLLDAVEERVETLLADRDEVVPLRGGANDPDED